MSTHEEKVAHFAMQAATGLRGLLVLMCLHAIPPEASHIMLCRSQVFHVMRRMDETGCDLFLDIHGDEEIAANFLAGSEVLICQCRVPVVLIGHDILFAAGQGHCDCMKGLEKECSSAGRAVVQ